MSNFSPMFFEQPIVIFDTTESLNSTSGAFVLYGGVSINAKYQTVDTSSGAFVLQLILMSFNTCAGFDIISDLLLIT